MEHTILHSDMNNCYASIELLLQINKLKKVLRVETESY